MAVENYKQLNAWYRWVVADSRIDVDQQVKQNETFFVLLDNGESTTAWDWTAVNVLSSGQTGNGVSTNTYDDARNFLPAGALIRITTTIGAAPTCTYTLEGSNDNSSFSSLVYADSATPLTYTSSDFVLTTATSVYKFIKPGQMFRYYRITYSLNTDVTNTADILVF